MIPKTFEMVNRKWKVVIADSKELQIHLNKHWNDDHDPEHQIQGYECKGFCDQAEAIIYLNSEKNGNRDDMEHTFHHELIHALFYANGLQNHDEALVDRLGGILHQALKTRKGDQ